MKERSNETIRKNDIGVSSNFNDTTVTFRNYQLIGIKKSFFKEIKGLGWRIAGSLDDNELIGRFISYS